VSHPPARTDPACRNCGEQAPLKFCPECGQETTLHPPTLGEFLHEFVGHYVALEGTLWRTLGVLLRRPGRLTREYLDGRRRKYVLPLRLYLTASFLFFLVLKLMPVGSPQHTVVLGLDGRRLGTVAELQASANAAAKAASGVTSAAASGAVALHRPTYGALKPVDCGAWNQRSCNFVESFLNNIGSRFGDNPEETTRHMQAHMLAWAPYLVFLLLPAFAGIMMLTYRNRHMTYGEHVVYSLHVHAFWFLVFLGIAILPDTVGGLLYLAVPVYGTLSMHEAYGGRWWVTVVRAVFVSAFYGFVLMLASVLGSVALVMVG
jgi:hypothetical protein